MAVCLHWWRGGGGEARQAVLSVYTGRLEPDHIEQFRIFISNFVVTALEMLQSDPKLVCTGSLIAAECQASSC